MQTSIAPALHSTPGIKETSGQAPQKKNISISKKKILSWAIKLEGKNHESSCLLGRRVEELLREQGEVGDSEKEKKVPVTKQDLLGCFLSRPKL